MHTGVMTDALRKPSDTAPRCILTCPSQPVRVPREMKQTLPAFEHGIDFFQHFHAFIVGDVAGSDNLAFHAGVVQQVFFNQYVRLRIMADQQDDIQKRGMVGKNELAGPAEFFQAVETDAQYARPLQVADKETPNFAYHASCFKLAFDVAFGRFERIG